MTESLAELLRSFRANALLSQEALAERSGLSTRTVSDIETGSARTPRLVTVMLLAEALGLSSSDRLRLREAARKPAPGHAGEASPAAVLHEVALVGRDADVARVSALVSREGVRLVTLAGPAGVGKTSLAIRVSKECAGAFELGAAFAELGPLDDPALVPGAVARALGVRESADTPPSEAVTAFLRDRRALLVLDNLEHLTPAVPWIASLIAACPRLTVLVTSREPLHLRAEHVYAVRPLESVSAVALFVARAQMIKPDFELTTENSAAIDTIVDHLEGLPLAIELAAPRLLLLTPKALAARLERRLPLLGDGAVDRPQRQQTMYGAIAWSYDLLSEDEQRLFRRLSVLQGGGSVEAAAATAGDAGVERPILFRLAPLVDKNMLSLVEDADGEPRVTMLEMLREYAHERLTESGELAEAQRRHALHVISFTQGAAQELSGAAQGRWLARYELEHGNIRAALQWLSRSGETAIGFQLIATTWRFWWMHGHLTDGVAWVRQFLAMRITAPASVADALYANVLRAHVVLLSALGNFDEAFASCEEAIALQRAIGDDAGLGASLSSLGIILQFRGEYDRAREVLSESLAIRKRLGDDAGVATSLSNLASIAFTKNDLATATALGNESVAIYRRLAHESGLAHALMKLALVAAAERNYERSEELFNECLRMQRAVGDTGSMYYSLSNLGAVAHRRGNYDVALARYHEALDLLDSIPNKSALAKTLEDLGATIAALGNPLRGARLLGAGDALRRAIGSPVFPSEKTDYDAEVARVRSMLGSEPFDVQWRIGGSITLQRALEEARQKPISTVTE
ncbi:MAG TPA: tetratricopeptide repeat protein [Candidatus Dormibacteraeota bacterium]|nr:tetratricopeptide repeat protein [Candidatus Dormibacteraeota bacterium]